MAFGYNSFKNFDESMSMLTDEINNSQNSINKRNDELCRLLNLIQISLQDIKDEIHSVNSANERNIELCYAIANLACSITLHTISQFDDVNDDLFDTLDALYAFRTKLYHDSKGEVYESTSFER